MAKTSLWIVLLVIAVLIMGGVYLLTTMTGKTVSNPPTTNKPSNNEPTTPPSTTKPQTYNINIENFAFNPATLTIKAGDTVTWTNFDNTRHTVTSDSGSELGSSLFGNGQTYSHTFNTAGTYNYHCTPHPNMKAKIIVE